MAHFADIPETEIVGYRSPFLAFAGGRELGVAGVGARVRALLNKDELPVIIQADARAEHGFFSDVWSEIKNAGAKKISVSTRND